MRPRTTSALCLILLTTLLIPPPASAAVTIEFLAPPAQWSAAEKEAVFYLKASGGTVSSLRCWIGSLNPERGDPGPRDSFECKAPDSMASGVIGQISLKLSPTAALKRSTYTALLQVVGTDQSGGAVSQTVSFKVIVPAVSLKIGETDTIRIRMIRPWPFSAAKAIIPVGVRVTSDLAPRRLPVAVSTQLYVQDGDAKDIVTDGALTAYFCVPKHETSPASSSYASKSTADAASMCDKPLGVASGDETYTLDGAVFELAPSVPSNVQKASGVLRLRSPEFASDIETPVTLLIKDFWLYAAIVVFLGQLLSFWVNNWITVGRQNTLNELEVAPLESSLTKLLISRPDLESHPEVLVIMTLLDSAGQANKLGEVESAKNIIKEAKGKFDSFMGNVPAPQPPLGGPAIVMLQKNRSYPGRTLNFVITNPDPSWLAGSVYKWEWSGQGLPWRQAVAQAEQKKLREMTKEYLDTQQWRVLYEAQDLKNISPRFWRTGQYILKLTVNSAQVLVLPFRLEKDTSLNFLSRIRVSDYGILLLAVVFAAILSYLAIDKLETFGSVSDYSLAFLGGFGLNATTSGFSAVISRFKAGPS
jgi:hypothetical protein